MRNAGRGSLGAPLSWMFSLLLIVSLLAPFTESAITEDGICNLFAFVPFTIGYVPSKQLVKLHRAHSLPIQYRTVLLI
jgi:hypothetical protein